MVCLIPTLVLLLVSSAFARPSLQNDAGSDLVARAKKSSRSKHHSKGTPVSKTTQHVQTTTAASTTTSSTTAATTGSTLTALTPAQVSQLAASTDKLSSSSSSPYIQFHNTVRQAHGAGAMTWDSALAAQALAHAQTCVFQHSSNLQNTGENIAYGTVGYYGAGDLMALWYNEVSQYNYNSPGFSSSTGHFTQMVWKGSSQLGCGMVDCTSAGLGNYLVCQYQAAGNVIGEFASNVSP